MNQKFSLQKTPRFVPWALTPDRELYLRAAGPRGHFNVIGTAEEIVDEMQARFDAYAADGFNLLAPTIPGGLTDFVELVLPELRRRDLFRTTMTAEHFAIISD